jgi:Uma2 family endonuclease
VDRIRESISPKGGQHEGCGCFHYADTYVRFPDGSLKRPDISIYCERPEDTDEAITLLPEAVIDVISKGYEIKDLQIGLPFYLAQGVKDVLIFNPDTLILLHARRDGSNSLVSPVEVELECGCQCRF